MGPDKIQILPTGNTPFILLDPAGFIKIKGKGMVINEIESYNTTMSWLDQYLASPAEVTYVSIALEYLNSFYTARLVTILQKIIQVTIAKKKLVVFWYYEEDDNDILERGEHISSTFNIPIEFLMTRDINNCI